MGKKFTEPTKGTGLLISAINRAINKKKKPNKGTGTEEKHHKKKPNLNDSKYNHGILSNIDTDFLYSAIQEFLPNISIRALGNLTDSITEEDELSKKKVILKLLSPYAIQLVERVKKTSIEKSNAKKYEKMINEILDMCEAADRGFLTKTQLVEKEGENGETYLQENEYLMSAEEAANIIYHYYVFNDNLQTNRIFRLSSIGISLASLLKELYTNIKPDQQKANKKIGINKKSLTQLVGFVLEFYKLNRASVNFDSRISKGTESQKNEQSLYYTMLQSSGNARERIKEKLIDLKRNNTNMAQKQEYRNFLKELVPGLIWTAISGMYIFNNASENGGTLDGKVFMKSMSELSKMTVEARNIHFIYENIPKILRLKKDYNFSEIEEFVKKMRKQAERVKKGEVVEFNSFKIPSGTVLNFRFEGNGEKNGLDLKIDEFSAKSGDFILLSGKSGVGKSSFLKMFAYGGCDNSNCIELNNGIKVSSLGEKCYYLDPKNKIGENNNVLSYIIGEDSIKNLSEEEKEQLGDWVKKLLPEIGNDPLNELESKSSGQFSNGQAQRLNLVKALYESRNNGSKVVILDDALESVDQKTVEDILRLISDEVKKRNIIVIFASHQVETLKKYATKVYNINDERCLVEEKNKDEAVISNNDKQLSMSEE